MYEDAKVEILLILRTNKLLNYHLIKLFIGLFDIFIYAERFFDEDRQVLFLSTYKHEKNDCHIRCSK